MLLLVGVVMACARGDASSRTAPPASVTPAPTTGASAPASTAPSPVALGSAPPQSPGSSPQVVAATVTDALRIEPAQMTVRAGQPVTFVVTNPGLLNHEFFVGDAAAQANHEFEMAARHAQVATDNPTGIALAPGQTRELTITFPNTGEVLAGCHIINHYPGGMKATITITN